MSVKIKPIGHVVGGRKEAIDDDWGDNTAVIALDPAEFDQQALLGLDDFSHAEIIFIFDKVPETKIERGARHPRGRKDWPRVGIFAQRGKNRPNRIGLTTCEVVAVDGLELTVRGLDAIDGTPVLDIKPLMRGFLARGEVREPEWAEEIMKEYWEV